MKLFHSEVEQSAFIDSNLPKDFTADELILLKTIFMIIEKAIDEIELPDKKSKTFAGSYIFDILKKAEVSVLDFIFLTKSFPVNTFFNCRLLQQRCTHYWTL